jgi:hypothetical protein
LNIESLLSVNSSGSRILVDLKVLLEVPVCPRLQMMLSTRVVTVCSASWTLSVWAALASAVWRKAVSCSISACWVVTISAVDVSVDGVSLVCKDWLTVLYRAMVSVSWFVIG